MKTITKIIIKIYDILAAPLYRSVPFIASMFLMSIMCFIHTRSMVGPFFVRFADIYLYAIITCLFSNKSKNRLECTFIIIALFLDIIEIFAMKNFGMLFSGSFIQLLSETNNEESCGFVKSYILTKAGLIYAASYILLSLIIIFIFSQTEKLSIKKLNRGGGVRGVICIIVIALLLSNSLKSIKSRYNFCRLISSKTSDEYFFINQKSTGGLGLTAPLWRIINGFKLVSFSKQELKLLEATMSRDYAQECHQVPYIVLFVGESHIKRHMQIYGYRLNTTPYQQQLMERGELYVFSDVITPMSSTSYVFKYIFSTADTETEDSYAYHVMFPVILKQSGYRTSLISNQFVLMDNEASSFGDAAFLSSNNISPKMFDYRNSNKKTFDHEILHYVDTVLNASENNFITFHVKGIHFHYYDKCPDDKRVFSLSDYECRKELSIAEKQVVCDYDNAMHYQDEVAKLLIQKFTDKEAIIIFVSDHGEEVFDFNHLSARQAYFKDNDVIKSEVEVPMWIWCSDIYKNKHPQIMEQIRSSMNKPFMTDDLSHLVLYLSGIKNIDKSKCLILPEFNTKRRRMIGKEDKVDYDKAILK